MASGYDYVFVVVGLWMEEEKKEKRRVFWFCCCFVLSFLFPFFNLL